jgi:hypothetical protein
MYCCLYVVDPELFIPDSESGSDLGTASNPDPNPNINPDHIYYNFYFKIDFLYKILVYKNSKEGIILYKF